MQRVRQLAAVAVLAFAAACAHAASDPSILRTDVFIATQYDANTALVLFSSNAAVPANPGVPVAAWPLGTPPWLPGARLQLVRSGEESLWTERWPGGASSAPQRGQQFVLALGGNARVHGMLSTLGYLPLCDTTWLVGLVTVDAADRALYAGASAGGMAAYHATPEILRVLPAASAGAKSDGIVPDVKNGSVLNRFPLAMLPMLDQAGGDAGEIFLIEEHGEGGALYSLQRQTPEGLVATGVYFSNHCK